ncbi:Auxin response factor 4 [Vitis vinifera]|uniref:Auxin response factor 4 n=1 Tax=Vitis vinifera TaxID=29760 RepID=A0A438DTJ9_VITVI|nr:Auxin response factor 4 [Vitis vinifera]
MLSVMGIVIRPVVFVCLSSSSSSSSASNSSASPDSSSIYLELWHVCAGRLTSLPKKGNVVVYFPQGHLEQAASSSPFPPMDISTFDLPPQIFCRVVNVQLLANKENDEVYTQVTLLPQPELAGINLEGKELEGLGVDEEGGGGSPTKSTPHMFCKTLTASDTSTHGGFSVPRRAAEDCFPPLDYKQQRPSQELVAKDLHGVEWRFRHIYRGQPRRHLLTTGWSIFVSQKNLVSGDAVLFLRGEGGELRLGIRRAVRPRNGLPDSIIGNQNSYPNVLSLAANAVATKSMFHVFYSPRY